MFDFSSIVHDFVVKQKESPAFLVNMISQEPTVQRSTRVFVVYENERWWLGAGWTKKLMLGERAPFSDCNGLVKLSREQFRLPGNQWRWMDQWKVEVIFLKNSLFLLQLTPKSDQEGWEYAYDFNKTWAKENNFKCYVRRRRWVRTCQNY